MINNELKGFWRRIIRISWTIQQCSCTSLGLFSMFISHMFTFLVTARVVLSLEPVRNNLWGWEDARLELSVRIYVFLTLHAFHGIAPGSLWCLFSVHTWFSCKICRLQLELVFYCQVSHVSAYQGCGVLIFCGTLDSDSGTKEPGLWLTRPGRHVWYTDCVFQDEWRQNLNPILIIGSCAMLLSSALWQT